MPYTWMLNQIVQVNLHWLQDWTFNVLFYSYSKYFSNILQYNVLLFKNVSYFFPFLFFDVYRTSDILRY